MENIIKQLVEMDKQARDLVAEHEKELDDLKAELEQQKQRISQNYLDRAQRRIKIIEQQGDEEIRRQTRSSSQFEALSEAAGKIRTESRPSGGGRLWRAHSGSGYTAGGGGRMAFIG
jgi:hypothetical protein